MISPEGHEECCLLGDFISGKSISWRCMTVAIAASVLYKNLANNIIPEVLLLRYCLTGWYFLLGH